MPTSLISPIRRDSFITFQSSNEDIELFNRSDKKFRFSHFALLKLPEIKEAVNNKNVMDFERIQSQYLSGNSTAVPPVEGDRIDISESFQNYLLNFESIMRSETTYDRSIVKNANERIFFKWMKEIGAMRWVEPTAGISNEASRYVEEVNNDLISSNYYERVVKYIGDISVQNKVSNNNNNLEEVYMFIPSQAGTFNNPLFKTISDTNYSEERAYTKIDQAQAEYLDGYSNTSIPINSLSLLAQYDIDVQGLTYTSINDVNAGDTDLWHDYYTGENAYLTDKTFSDPSNDTITVDGGSGGLKEFLRSRLDGVSLDLEKSSYTVFNDPTIDTFSSASESGESFDFNCVLLYYELEENGVVETNLYGVLFIDDLEELAGGISKIRTQQKIRTSTLLGQTGTGFGIKLNFRVDNANGNIVPEVVTEINDYNVFSLQLFSEASARMTSILERYERVLMDNEAIKKQNEELTSLLLSGVTDPSVILEQINSKLITDPNLSGALELINKNYQLIQSILGNETAVPIELAITPNFHDGIVGSINNGILDLALSKSAYGDVYSHTLDTNYSNTNITNIGKRKSLSLFALNNPTIVDNDINIYLNDKDGWNKLQSVKVHFNNNINVDGVMVNVFTDVNSKVSNQSYGLIIGSFKLVGNSFEVICINELTYEFRIIN